MKTKDIKQSIITHEKFRNSKELSRAEIDDILKQRARDLAVEHNNEKPEERIEIVEFMLAHETYGIETKHISEVCSLSNYTPVPCTPSFVLGIINVHGQIYSVIDLKEFFHLPQKGLSNANKVIILHDENNEDHMKFGILADSINSVRHIPLSEIQASLPTLTDKRKDFLKGVTADQFVILDAYKILNDKNLVVDQKIGD
ncbi:MAG: purine-binding chemotaxis protein CheW [Bacteroidales bacterium]|nr:purine-binding chemotaxis protein CheW [Bacteroidales bacterium]